MGDITFNNLDRDINRAGTWYDNDRDAKACQDKDDDREAGNLRLQRK
jgi:hypothetical protein